LRWLLAPSRRHELRATATPLLWTLLFSAVYVGADAVSRPLSFPSQLIAAYYPPGALTLAALLLVPQRRWIYCFAGAFVAQLTITIVWDDPLWTAFAFFAANSIRELLAAVLLRRVVPTGCVFGSERGIGSFILSAIGAPLLSAFLGAAIPTVLERTPTYWIAWRTWFLSSALAYLTIVPPLVVAAGRVWYSESGPREASLQMFRSLRASRAIEAGGLFAGLAAACLASFAGAAGLSTPLLYVLLLCVLWAAIRFGPEATSLAILLVTATSTWDAMSGNGPFQAPTTSESVIALQIFLLAISAPMLFLAAIVHEREKALAQLRESERRYVLATQAGRVFLFDGDLDTRKLEVDPLVARLLGIDPSLGLTMDEWLRRVHPGDAAAVIEWWAAQALGTTLSSPPIELRMLHADGTVRWFSASCLIYRNDDGTPQRFLGTATDVTERKLAELEAERQRDQLARVSRVATVGELGTSLAHELSQPLLAILINAQVAERVSANEEPDLHLVQEVVRDVVADARHAADVISGMRAFLRNEEPERARLDVNALLRQVATLIHGDAVRRRVSLRLELEPRLPAVIGDRVQLQQVALNLLLNGFDAIADQPDDVHRRKVVVRTSIPAAGQEIEVAVSDSGPGIDERQMPRIFEPFFTTKRGGLGMGLSICRSIVEKHGGHIGVVNNQHGRGATVSFRLPVADAAAVIEPMLAGMDATLAAGPRPLVARQA
jgi:PAS domain S-box-containing protein